MEYCDKCGTELESSQRRHRTYRVETPARDRDALEGRLCSDCVVEFENWLQRETPVGD